MARRYGEPISVQTQDGRPVQFRWRGVIYRVRVIGTWRLATRWWERETVAAGAAGAGKETGKGVVDRVYFRVQAADQQVFELYCEMALSADKALSERWVLDVCLD